MRQSCWYGRGVIVVMGMIIITWTIMMAGPLSHRVSSASSDGMDKLVALTEANTHFALDLYQEFSSKSENNNVFFSPISLSAALSMTYLGAAGNTAKQMLSVLNFQLFERDFVHSTFNDLFEHLNKESEHYKLCVANRIYPRLGYTFSDRYLTGIEQNYGAKIMPLDFKENPKGSRLAINKWVEDKTASKIKNLIPENAIDPELTVMILVNAIYFKGNWSVPFKSSDTKDNMFYSRKSETSQIKMMYNKAKFKFAQLDAVKSQVLELPYKGDSLSMVFILPNDKDGLPALEKSLTSALLANITGSLYQTKVKVYLPKFRLENSYSMPDFLRGMGLSDLFQQGTADLSGMDGTRKLFVSDIFHKAFINVDEMGTEAAAATGMMMMLTSIEMEEVPVFRADHPFIFFIRDNLTGSVLFMGRLVKPGNIVKEEL